MTPPIVLASTSAIRRQLLTAACVPFEAIGSGVDEAPIKAAALEAGVPPAAVARRLAEAKALAVSRWRPDAVVIGADQLLEFEGAVLDKPTDLAAAEARLRGFRGKSHRLLGAVVIARNGQVVDAVEAVSVLTVRDFSEAALASHMAAGGADLLESVGGYRVEAEGAQLFETIEGDLTAILGLPLVPTLAMLRAAGALPS
jgi:septum formation protein